MNRHTILLTTPCGPLFQVRDAISSMLFIDLMFWKTPNVAEEVRADYFMRLDHSLLKASKTTRRNDGDHAG